MSLNTDEVLQELSPWVVESLRKEDVEDVKIEVTGTSDKGDNYMGDIIFLEATGRNKFKNLKTFHLVIKKGKDNQAMRDEWQAKMFYLRENRVYDVIFPGFKKFQLERNVKELFDAVPKCYGTLDKEQTEAILFENLKKNGYELHDRFVNMNEHHIKLVLKNYAKFHAISFAMRDQQKQAFDELTKDFPILFLKTLKKMGQWYDEQFAQAVELVKEIDNVLVDKINKKVESGLANMMINLFSDQVKECVVIHGDCWNNNFMFKYDGETKEIPSKVAILDWQLSAVHSPVIDLSYFLYLVSSQKEVNNFDEFFRYYHEKLSESIRELGSDPEKLFPFSKLVEHWNKYSCFGMGQLVAILRGITCDKENVVAIEDFEDPNEALDAWKSIKPKNYELYKERLFANLKHYSEGIKTF